MSQVRTVGTASGSYEDILDVLYSLLSTTAYAHAGYISSTILIGKSACVYMGHSSSKVFHSYQFFPMLHSYVQCIQINFQIIVKSLPTMVLWTLSCLQFTTDIHTCIYRYIVNKCKWIIFTRVEPNRERQI